MSRKDAVISKFNRVMGVRTNITRKPLIEYAPHVVVFPVRTRSLGKTNGRGSTQGVGGWRVNYYRPPMAHELTPAKKFRIWYPEDTK